MARIIAITGGIGSGKTTVTDYCLELGYPVIDTDQLSRQAVAPGTQGLAAISDKFGVEILQPNGELDRAKLRQQVFNNPNAKQWLEDLLHPIIQQLTQEQVKKHRQQNAQCIFVAIPLLVEGIEKTGQKPEYIDEIWVVDCSPQTQLQRASNRDNQTVADIQKIIDQQVSREKRLAFADHVLDNDSDPAHLKQQLMHLLAAICN